MENVIKIFIFTATRAEYGLLRWIVKALQEDPRFETYLIVGGTHLSLADGYTLEEIKEDGVKNIIQLPFLNASRTSEALSSSIGTGIIQLSKVFDLLKPDFSLVLGDRYELFIFAITSMMFKTPIIHIAGGERTEGVIDEQVRHAITKMAHIHMVTTEFYAENVSKMGEEDWRIHIVGSPGLENIKKLKLYSKEEIYNLLGINLDYPTVLCTYHPVTLENEENTISQVKNLLESLSQYDIQVILTKPNAEVGSDKITDFIKNFIKDKKNMYLFDSLGSKMYLSIMQYAKAVVGNSSSGIIEAPSFNIPTLNIGDRQKGRFRPESVVDVGYSLEDIKKGLEKVLFDKEFLDRIKNIKNPYGDGNTSQYVLEALNKILDLPKEKLLKKTLDFEVKKDEWHRYF